MYILYHFICPYSLADEWKEGENNTFAMAGELISDGDLLKMKKRFFFDVGTNISTERLQV